MKATFDLGGSIAEFEQEAFHDVTGSCVRDYEII